MPQPLVRAFIFDLDGTLVDTLGDIATVVNEFLRSRGWPEHPKDDYRLKVGRGLANLIRNAVPPAFSDRVDEYFPEVFSSYEAMGTGTSQPYPGVTQVLGSLAERGVPLAVVSNKPDAITKDMVETLFASIPFAFVRGAIDGVPSKPDPTSALAAARACGVPAGECAFIGDSNIDVHTALAAGMLPVGAAWGFRGPDELIEAGAVVMASSITEIPALLNFDGQASREQLLRV